MIICDNCSARAKKLITIQVHHPEPEKQAIIFQQLDLCDHCLHTLISQIQDIIHHASHQTRSHKPNPPPKSPKIDEDITF